MWHCHVEPAHHIQMGMLGNLYILPIQHTTCAQATPASGPAYGFTDAPRTATCNGLPVNDADGTNGYDEMYFLQETAFDPDFHHADQTYQKIACADMNDTYSMLNGRGYPDTVNPDRLPNGNGVLAQPIPAIAMTVDATGNRVPQTISAGQRVLVRLSSLSTVDFFTVTVLGIPMRVV